MNFFKLHLTLRLRLALWTTLLLFVASLGLLLFINLSVRESQNLVIYNQPGNGATPGQTSPGPLPAPSGALQGQQDLLSNLRTFSLIGLAGVVILGGLGAYWLAGISLRPVSRVSRAALRISATTLDTRLELNGPPDELKELVNTFNNVLDRLEAAFEQQGRFVADAAHELRTPLATFRTSLEVTAQNPAVTVKEYRELISRLKQTLSRLEQLVEDLLILATQKQPVSQQEVALGPLIEEVFGNLAPLAGSWQVTLQLEGDAELTVPGNDRLLSHVFTNLVENGIRYNHSQGEVRVCLESQPNWAIIKVVDTGIGIAPGEQSRIFDRFYRVDQSRGRQAGIGGSGLGLAIARHIVDQHKGQLSVESASGQGSTFTVQLPLQTTV